MRNGNDFTTRFPQIAAAVVALRLRSCLIDGEAIVTGESGLAVFGSAAPTFVASAMIVSASPLGAGVSTVRPAGKTQGRAPRG